MRDDFGEKRGWQRKVAVRERERERVKEREGE